MMLELVGSGLLGSIVGGLFRLAPEFIKFWDRKDERKHELNMFSLQTELEKVKGEFKVEEKYVDYSIANMQALATSHKAQSDDASSSYKWVSAASALVRPAVTYVLFGMYVLFKISMITYGTTSGVPWTTVMQNSWTPDDFAMLNGILMYWFLNRSIEKYKA